MTACTLGGVAVTSLRLTIPAYGLWWAEVECASQDVLSGPVSLVLDDLTLTGTVVTGGAYQLRTRYRVVAGAGGWGKTIAAYSYANDLGVKSALVLRDAAAACGETLGTLPAGTLGPAWARASGPASRVLDAVAPRGWYVDNDGVTQIGKRAAVAYASPYQQQVNDAAQQRIDIAPAPGAVAALVPGVIIDGLGEAVDVEHTIDGGALRTSIWGAGIASTARLPEALRRIVEAFTAGYRFFAPWEYRIVTTSGDRLDLQAVRVSAGMPDLRAVPTWPRTTYIDSVPPNPLATPTLGSTVLVAFANGDPARPVVLARAGDPVLIGASVINAANMVATGATVAATVPLIGRIGVGS